MIATTSYDLQLARLGEAIAADGLAPYEGELASVAARARRHMVRPVAVDVLLDCTAPSVVRERAFALVAMALTAVGTFEPTGSLARVA